MDRFDAGPTTQTKSPPRSRQSVSSFQLFTFVVVLSNNFRCLFQARGGAKLGPPIKQGKTRAEKLRGQNLGPNTDQRPGWLLGAGGVAPSRCDGPGYDPRKIFENSYAKSCILVTTCCKISCFFENHGQEVGEPIHCWSPT